MSMFSHLTGNKNTVDTQHKELTGPIMCAPSSLSVTLSPRTFTNPSVSLLVLALLFAVNGNLPTLNSTP